MLKTSKMLSKFLIGSELNQMFDLTLWFDGVAQKWSKFMRYPWTCLKHIYTSLWLDLYVECLRCSWRRHEKYVTSSWTATRHTSKEICKWIPAKNAHVHSKCTANKKTQNQLKDTNFLFAFVSLYTLYQLLMHLIVRIYFKMKNKLYNKFELAWAILMKRALCSHGQLNDAHTMTSLNKTLEFWTMSCVIIKYKYIFSWVKITKQKLIHELVLPDSC